MGDKFAALQETAAVLLEYKGPDTQQAIAVVRGVHDPALEGEEPASGDAAAAAMREARLIARDKAVLAAARTKGAELAASLARLRAQENKLRLSQDARRGPSLHAVRALDRESPLLRGQQHGPLYAQGFQRPAALRPGAGPEAVSVDRRTRRLRSPRV